MANNAQLYNAAIAGFLGGVLQERQFPAAIPAAELTNATTFAVAVDAAIPLDATIVTPTDAVTLRKVNLLLGICMADVAGRAPPDASGFTTQATTIAAAYNAGVALFV